MHAHFHLCAHVVVVNLLSHQTTMQSIFFSFSPTTYLDNLFVTTTIIIIIIEQSAVLVCSDLYTLNAYNCKNG